MIFWDGFCLHDLKTSCIASHMHYNYIFMHLDVCYICSIDCVLVGLDWVEPMMQFLLHVTCSCIFHTFFRLFNILIIVNCFGAFLIVSFFPLFIFCLRYPLHSGASSSSNLAPLSLHFRNDDAYKAFTEKFSRRGIHSKHRVILGHFANIDLPTVIHSRE